MKAKPSRVRLQEPQIEILRQMDHFISPPARGMVRRGVEEASWWSTMRVRATIFDDVRAAIDGEMTDVWIR